MKELFTSKVFRDAKLKELRRAGHHVQAYSVRSTSYLRARKVLYGIRQEQTGPYLFERQVDALPDALK